MKVLLVIDDRARVIVYDEARYRLVWGWLRMLLGWAQMVLAAAAVIALILIGFHAITWALAAAAVAAVISRLVYRGGSGTNLKERK
jgi:hypothetical protein